MQQASKTNKVQSVQSQAKSSRSCPCSTHALRPLTPLRLLVLPESPLVALDLHPAVVADGRWDCLDPIGRALSNHFTLDGSMLLSCW